MQMTMRTSLPATCMTEKQAMLLRTIVAEGICHAWAQEREHRGWSVLEEHFDRKDGDMLLATGMIMRHPDPKKTWDIGSLHRGEAYVPSPAGVREVERRAIIASTPTAPLRAPRLSSTPNRGTR